MEATAAFIDRIDQDRKKLRINPYYDMNLNQMTALYLHSQKKPCEAIEFAFRFGYQQGRKATLSELKKNKKI